MATQYGTPNGSPVVRFTFQRSLRIPTSKAKNRETPIQPVYPKAKKNSLFGVRMNFPARYGTNSPSGNPQPCPNMAACPSSTADFQIASHQTVLHTKVASLHCVLP